MAFRYLSQNRVRTLDTFPSILKKTSLGKSLISLPSLGGEIQVIRLHAANDIKFNATLFEKNTSVAGDINNIFKVDGVQKQIQLTNQGIWYLNEDDPSGAQLWFDLFNDSNTDSGVITLSLTINNIGSGSKVSIPKQ